MEKYCCILLATSASPQISDVQPDMRKRVLFVTSRAPSRWSRMLLAQENIGGLRAAIVVPTEHKSRCASGCQPPSVDKGTDSRLNLVPAAWRMPVYLENLAVHAA